MAAYLLGIRGRLVLLALAAAVPALLAVLYSAYTQYEQATEEAEAQVLRFAEVIASREQVMIDEARSVLALLSRNSRIADEDSERCSALLREMHDSGVINITTLMVISVAKPDGQIHCSTAPITDAIRPIASGTICSR